MKKTTLLFSVGMAFILFLSSTDTALQDNHRTVSPKPPMGWNSYDAYHGAITEKLFKASVDIIAEKMYPVGYEYAVVDFCWYHPGTKGWDPHNWTTFPVRGKPYQNGQPSGLQIDENGRLLPAFNRFPSAEGGTGFKALADYTRAKGMKFGIHIMRGVPRQAVEDKLPILGTSYTCDQIAEKFDTCRWNNHMYGIDASKPGAQEYYNSLFELYASWDVDYIKVDDITTPYYRKGEVELIHNAIARCGRPMVLSLSPGQTPLAFANHLDEHANMWRVSSDFWDSWDDLYEMFDLMNNWTPHIGNGTWPDADMIPIGKLCLTGYPQARGNKNHSKVEHYSRFSYDEKQMLMTLWSVSRSPLMWGGDPLSLDDETIQLLCNKEVLEVNQNSENNRQIYAKFRGDGQLQVWFADIPNSEDKYIAFFNRGEETTDMYFDFWWEDLTGSYKFRDLWKMKDVGEFEKDEFKISLKPHSSALFKMIKTKS